MQSYTVYKDNSKAKTNSKQIKHRKMKKLDF